MDTSNHSITSGAAKKRKRKLIEESLASNKRITSFFAPKDLEVDAGTIQDDDNENAVGDNALGQVETESSSHDGRGNGEGGDGGGGDRHGRGDVEVGDDENDGDEDGVDGEGDIKRKLLAPENQFPNVVTSSAIKSAIIESGPSQPQGPFPKDETQGRAFSSSYYSFVSKSGIRMTRHWLCYSVEHDCAYCLPCWLFLQKDSSSKTKNQRSWSTVGFRDWKHLSERIHEHEVTDSHSKSCVIYEEWRRKGTIENLLETNLEQEKTFWAKVIKRILDVTLVLATNNLAFRGTSENMEDNNKGNFLSIIELLAKYDPVLEELLRQPKGSVKYLSPQIQNEIIALLAKEVEDDIKNELKEALFFSFIFDTTQDASKTDQLSEVYRYVKIVKDDDGKPLEVKVCETFTGFTKVRDQSASGLKQTVFESVKEKDLDIKKCRGQGYDGAAVMSGAYTGLQKQITDVAPDADYVHCCCHNLNLVLKDAVSSSVAVTNFFDLVEAVYAFFGNSILRWQVLQSAFSNDENFSPGDSTPGLGPEYITLKRLNPTRFAGRYDAVYALQVRLPDVLKSLTRIILTSKKTNERSEAESLKRRLENFEFVFLLILQCKILKIINIPSKSLQTESMDLFRAKELLEHALASVSELREKFQDLVAEASKICEKLGIQARFQERRSRGVKRNYDGLAVDETSHTPEDAFRISTFLPMIDTVISQLNRRFEGTRRVAEKYQVVQPKFLSESTEEELRVEAEKFAKNFPDDVSPMFPAQILSLRMAMKDRISKMSSVMELATFLIVENNLLSSSFPDVCTACLMFLTVPVTVAKAERTFSKLNIIKNYLRCSISQERLSNLALLSIEHEKAQNIDFSLVTEKFANAKARKKKIF